MEGIFPEHLWRLHKLTQLTTLKIYGDLCGFDCTQLSEVKYSFPSVRNFELHSVWFERFEYDLLCDYVAALFPILEHLFVGAVTIKRLYAEDFDRYLGKFVLPPRVRTTCHVRGYDEKGYL